MRREMGLYYEGILFWNLPATVTARWASFVIFTSQSKQKIELLTASSEIYTQCLVQYAYC